MQDMPPPPKPFGLIKNTAFYAVSLAVARGVGLLLIPLYTNTFTTHEYGVLSLLMVIVVYANGFYGLGLNEAFERFYLNSSENKSRSIVFSTTMLGIAASSFVLFLFGALVFGKISHLFFDESSYWPLIVLSFLIPLCDQIGLIQLQLLKVQHRAKTYTKFLFVNGFVNLSFNIFLVGYLKMGISGALWSMLISSSIMALLLIIVSKSFWKGRPSWSTAKAMYNYGIPFVPVFLSLTTIEVVDRYFLRSYASLDVVGIYSIGYRIGSIMLMMMIAFNNAWSPFALQRGREPDYVSLFSKLFSAFIVLSGMGFLLVAHFIPVLLGFSLAGYGLLGKAFQNAIPIVPMVMGAYVLLGCFYIFVVVLELRNKTKHLTGIAIIAAAINVLGNILLIPRLSGLINNGAMIGAAISTVFAYAFLALGTLYFARKYLIIPYEWVKVTSIVALTVGCYFLPCFSDSYSIILKFIALIVYLVAIMAFKLVPLGELRQIIAKR